MLGNGQGTKQVTIALGATLWPTATCLINVLNLQQKKHKYVMATPGGGYLLVNHLMENTTQSVHIKITSCSYRQLATTVFPPTLQNRGQQHCQNRAVPAGHSLQKQPIHKTFFKHKSLNMVKQFTKTVKHFTQKFIYTQLQMQQHSSP